ncbi:MFS general substrate transporter [Saitoella complicata NRRL Y-17804]|uniref:MFS general substrate transporter n=1 Tax=Saitoella complicata (strain BCRC 22490 / CBS 7301 / JCM 7358 / NBRC 10748 / NRRL Y-17804) TaxID=698492 RepID=UPI000866BE9E|nr:MFS general substrate transporter [Saitoella complicata NRRL Y-17804]ODQ54685.1 MFS general substrate transporter [Saitoella complicata NRRL Y-17804]
MSRKAVNRCRSSVAGSDVLPRTRDSAYAELERVDYDDEHTEDSPLLRPSHDVRDIESASVTPTTSSSITAPNPPRIGSIIAVLLLGSLISNADGSFVLATSVSISSEFSSLQNSSWLIASYTLAMCASQPLYGKLSDIYGRKGVLLAAYAFFGIGCAICGFAGSMGMLVLGRVVSGVGGAGMSALVSILITDLVPLREVAKWRSYVNVASTFGRSIGGPLGGWLTDTVGWRWSFFGQAPLTLLAAVLVYHKLPDTGSSTSEQIHRDDGSGTKPQESHRSKLTRIDFVGAALLASTITAFLLILELGGTRLPYTSTPLMLILLSTFVSFALFLITESCASEPIFPLSLLCNAQVLLSYWAMLAQLAAQMGMMYLVPLYFQVTQSASTSVAGAHLLPAVVGNTVGALLTGVFIHRTGRYKLPAVSAGVVAAVTYILLILTWHGETNWIQSLFIIPGGFGTGIAQTAVFIALTSAVQKSAIAIATSGLYLASNIGMVLGVSLTSAVLRTSLALLLGKQDVPEEVITRVLQDVEEVQKLAEGDKMVVVGCYVHAIEYTHVLSLVLAVTAVVAGLFLRQRRIG